MIVHVLFGGICRSDCQSGTCCKAPAKLVSEVGLLTKDDYPGTVGRLNRERYLQRQAKEYPINIFRQVFLCSLIIAQLIWSHR